MHKPLKSLAVALAACAATLLAGRSALVSVSDNTTLGGTYQAPSFSTTEAALQQVLTPTIFENDVFLFDDPSTPLHHRLPASTNSTEAIVAAVVDKLVETNLWVDRWPYTYLFETNNVPAGSYPHLSTNFYGLRLGYYSPGYTVGIHSRENAGMFVPGNYILIRGNGYSYFVSTNRISIESPETISDGDIKAASFTLGEDTITNWPSGGGGLSGARVSATNTTVDASDYLIWLDTRAFSSSDSVTLTLSDMAVDSQTIVVRRLGGTGTATIARGTNTWTLAYDGDGVTIDWIAAATNWFWRTF